MLLIDLITLGVKNKAPQVSFKNFVVGDSISYYGAHTFSLHGSIPPLLSYMVTCSFPLNDNGVHHHSLGADIPTFGSSSQAPQDSFGIDITFLGSKFKYKDKFHLIFCQITSFYVHGSSFHHPTVYFPDSVEQIHNLSKKKIPQEIII